MSAAPNDFGRVFRRRRKGKKKYPGWYIRVRRGDKEITLVGGLTHKAARQKLLALQEELDRQARGQEGYPDVILFEDFAERFLSTSQGRYSATTYKDICNKVRNLLTPAFKGKVVCDIRKPDIVRFLDSRPADLSPATRNRELSALSAILEKAVELGFAAVNPTRGIKRPDEGMKPVPFLSPEAQERLVAKCPEVIRPVILLAIETGLRKSEMLSLLWQDVHLDRDLLVVRESKNGCSREVPLTERARAALLTLRNGKAPKSPDSRGKVIDWLGKGWNRHHDRKLKDAVKAAELPPMTLHSMRHVHGASLAQAGVPIPVISTLLGHRTMRVTMRYARHSPEDATKRAVALLQRWKNGKAPDEVKETEATLNRSRVRVPRRVPRESVRRCPVTS